MSSNSKPRKFNWLTRPIFLLGMVSLFTDVASEMLYPILPAFFGSIGMSVAFMGVLEGLAQGIAAFSKGYFGQWSDNLGKRVPFLRAGYGLSAVAKPLMAVFLHPWWVLFSRTLDRLGKGTRTAARDALLSQYSEVKHRGKVYGFHRGMDTLGAAIGPLLALAFLFEFPGQYRWLLLIALIPGLVAVLFTLLVKEPGASISHTRQKTKPLVFFKYLPHSPRHFQKLLVGLVAFALINSSDFFLLLMIRELTGSDQWMIGLYVCYNLVYAIAAYPSGWLSDRLGMKPVFISGLILFALVYAGFGAAQNTTVMTGLMLLYGAYAALTKGNAKAWISHLVPSEVLGTAMGSYTSLQSMGTLLSSILAGVIWEAFGPSVLFIATAAGTGLIVLYLLLFAPATRNT